ncbi:calcyclin-binding protein [Tribolium castaneum]|uniref:Calcyclin-binding protein n=2 Tax=Tribolium castaneum TaxID=7070 RepID=D7GXT5_TRICA|nr:PREDICTED: calcyclin-binding protein [Tribolium castaneum]EFA13571.1 Calcyclin-binding protein-like Protein [Tribolium castaneum]|eukprot:XP_967766.1 PREDICTED: calcyclin-binding protein [Tribolium castaneum]
MSGKIDELKKDLAELQALEAQATRHKVKDFLSLEVRKISTEITKLQEQLNTTTVPTPVTSTNKRYRVKLNNYAWDQTSKFVKFYVTLPKVQTIPPENVVCHFTNKSLELEVRDLENKDYVFTINNLLGAVDPAASNWKIKSDMVVINASKVKGDPWSHVTELEKKVDDAQKAKFKTGDNVDPNEGIMSLMKNMYETGDDEMKRTIAKAWTESQMKSSSLS